MSGTVTSDSAITRNSAAINDSSAAINDSSATQQCHHTVPATSGHEATAASLNARSPISPANELLHLCTTSDVDMVTLAP